MSVLCKLSSFFRRRKKKQKSRWDTCDCVPSPATLFWVSEKINACFLIVGTFVLGCMRYLLFSGEEKRSKKVAGTLAIVSRTPQRFKVSVKLRCVAPATLFLESFLNVFFQKRKLVYPLHKQKNKP